MLVHVNSGARDPERCCAHGHTQATTRAHSHKQTPPEAGPASSAMPRRTRQPRLGKHEEPVQPGRIPRAGVWGVAHATAVLTNLDPHALEDPQSLFLHRHAACRPRQRARARQRGRRRGTRQGKKPADGAERRMPPEPRALRSALCPGAPPRALPLAELGGGAVGAFLRQSPDLHWLRLCKGWGRTTPPTVKPCIPLVRSVRGRSRALRRDRKPWSAPKASGPSSQPPLVWTLWTWDKERS